VIQPVRFSDRPSPALLMLRVVGSQCQRVFVCARTCFTFPYQLASLYGVISVFEFRLLVHVCEIFNKEKVPACNHCVRFLSPSLCSLN